MKDNLEGASLFFGLVIIFLVMIGFLNNFAWIKDIWNLLQKVSDLIGVFL